MYSSQLLLVLRSFEKKELKLFEAFLHSPYFHHKKINSSLLALWEYLYKGLHKKGVDYFDKPRVYEHLFPQQDFAINKLEKLMSQLYSLVKDFLVVQATLRDSTPEQKLRHLLNTFSQRELQGPAAQVYRKLKKLPQQESFGWGGRLFLRTV